MKPMSKHFILIWLFIVVSAIFFFLIWNLVSHFKQSSGQELSGSLQSALKNFPDSKATNSKLFNANSSEPLSNRIVEYHIAVELLTDGMVLSGAQTLTWKNPGERSVDELYFHLYPNAFESKQTTFQLESGGKLRNDQMKEDSFGNMQILSMKMSSGEDLFARLSFVQPDDGNTNDRTLMKLVLPSPLEPGEKITLMTQFQVQLPAAFARMGYVDDYVLAGQWFPKLAAYETQGTRGIKDEGWNLHQYHGNSEFYANFGIYDVQIKVPAHYTVAATGFPIKSPVTEGGSKLYHYYAEDVHDFAWAASPHFIYIEEPFSAPNVPGVKIKLYLDPAHEYLKNRYLLAAKKSLTRFSEWMGEYPYSTLSIVVPPEGGNGTGGMEYPTLITAWAASETKPGFELERVIVHEIGHQYWYGMIASNEFEEAWLDEGFTSYIEDKLMATEYGVHSNLPLEASYITNPAPLNLHAWNYRDHQHYADNVYTRAKLVLVAIEQQIGEAMMNKVLKTYFQRWKFNHPGSQDFQTVLEEVTKSNWSDFFHHFVYGKKMVDYAIENIHIRKTSDSTGVQYMNTVTVKKIGAADPAGQVSIRFQFADGSYLDQQWDGKDEIVRFKIKKEVPIAWAMIDPHYQLVLENIHINNFMKAKISKESSVRWNLGISQALEMLFNIIAW